MQHESLGKALAISVTCLKVPGQYAVCQDLALSVRSVFDDALVHEIRHLRQKRRQIA